MESYFVQVMPRAQDDVLSIVAWIKERSSQGAVTWYAAYENLLDRLKNRPLACGTAPEAQKLGRDLRQAMFKTRQGNLYRGIFMIEDDTVYLLRVRGPGQQPLTQADI
jgi:hypothetical protein